MSAPQHAVDANADQPIVEFAHRYPWRGEEIAIIATLLTLPALAVTVLGAWGTGTAITVAVFAAFGLYLCHLGKSRKDRSALRATVQGTLLRVEPTGSGKYGSSGDLADMVVVRVSNTHQIDPLLNFETSPNGYGTTRSVRVPMRLARVMAPHLAPHLARCTKAGDQTNTYAQEILDLAQERAQAASQAKTEVTA